MIHHELSLPADPASAIRELKEASRTAAVVVFKKSPVCPISSRAEAEFRRWLEQETRSVSWAVVDVIENRSLARGVTAELGIRHESPQALVFGGGELRWHDSHGALTADRFREVLEATS